MDASVTKRITVPTVAIAGGMLVLGHPGAAIGWVVGTLIVLYVYQRLGRI